AGAFGFAEGLEFLEQVLGQAGIDAWPRVAYDHPRGWIASNNDVNGHPRMNGQVVEGVAQQIEDDEFEGSGITAKYEVLFDTQVHTIARLWRFIGVAVHGMADAICARQWHKL